MSKEDIIEFRDCLKCRKPIPKSRNFHLCKKCRKQNEKDPNQYIPPTFKTHKYHEFPDLEPKSL